MADTGVHIIPNMGAGLSLAGPRDFIDLMKPRVMSLVVFTAMVGLFCAPGAMPPIMAALAILCIAAGAGASGALNMWYDRDIDALMTRTRKRPIPRGAVTPSSALAFGLFVSIFSVAGLAFASNYYAAGLLAFTIFFYAVVYSMWLKRSTPQNIVIGGAAGAFPPMIGYAAVMGSADTASLASVFPPESILLFLIIFLWTPPHFWALALYKSGDYEKAGIPMMPNVAGPESTRRQIFIYSLLLAAVCAGLGFTNFASMPTLVLAGLLNVGFIAMAFKVWRSRAGESASASDEASLYAAKVGDKAARNLFAYSILYLFALFGVIAAGSFIGGL